MQIPEGKTEQEVIGIINNIGRRLAYKFRFGYHDIDDIKQEAFVEAIRVLPKYDNKRPLENFLYVAVHNRLFNNKRDKFERPDKPCLNCPLQAYIPETGDCSAYDDMLECKLYKGWITRNAAKKNLMQPIGLDGVHDEQEDNMKTMDDIPTIAMHREIVEILDREIPLALRPDWIKMRREMKIPKARREKLLKAVQDILEEHNIDVQEAWAS